MTKEEFKILEDLRHIRNSKNEAIVILNNYFKGGVGKSKLSTMFAYLTDKLKIGNQSVISMILISILQILVHHHKEV